MYLFHHDVSEILATEEQELAVNVGADEDNLPAADLDITTDTTTISQLPRVVKDVVTNLRLAMGYDEMSQYKSDGFDVSCCMLSDGGFEGDKDEMWKFHIMSITEDLATLQSKSATAAATSSSSAVKVEGESAAEQNEDPTADGADPPAGDAEVASDSKEADATAAAADEGSQPPTATEEDAPVVMDESAAPASTKSAAPASTTVLPSTASLGVEDVVWVSVSKASGAAVAVPEGYSLLSETDLAPAEDADSVFLAVKMGPTPRIAGIRMYCTAAAEGDVVPPALDAVIANCFPGREMTYRAAPRAIEAMHSGPCGLLLEV